MSLVFDTSILVSLEKGNQKTITKLRELSQSHPNPALLSFMTYFEFLSGTKERNLVNRDKAFTFLNRFEMLRPHKNTANLLAELKYKYQKKGISLSLTDLFIAAQVIENNMVLVTSDKDFEKINELKKIIVD